MTIEQSTARLLRQGLVCGGAVVLPEGRLATAAHCINLGVGVPQTDSADKIGSVIQVDFPASADRSLKSATVVAWRGPGDEDISILSVDEIPTDVSVPQFDAAASWPHLTPVAIHGFPGGERRTNRGTLRGSLRKNRYAFYVEDDADVSVAEGHSGGPVYWYDSQSEHVVGITLSYQPRTRMGRFSRMADVLELAGAVARAAAPMDSLIRQLEWFLNEASFALLLDLEARRSDGIPDVVCNDIASYLAELALGFERIEDRFKTADDKPLIVASVADRPSQYLQQFRSRYVKWNRPQDREGREEAWQSLQRARRKAHASYRKVAAALIAQGYAEDHLHQAANGIRQLAEAHGDPYLPALLRCV
jgi:hypothetical protein